MLSMVYLVREVEAEVLNDSWKWKKKKSGLSGRELHMESGAQTHYESL